MGNTKDVRERIQDEVPFEEVESSLSSLLDREGLEREIVEKVIKYDNKILTDGGKRVRVAIPFLMAKGLDIDLDDYEIVEALIPLEVFHGASLLIDDVIDEDEKRRGMKTPHERFVEYGYSSKQAESITVLDATEIQSLAVTASFEMDFLSPEQKIKISEIVKNSVSDVARSQVLDVSAENLLKDGFEENLEYEDKSLEYESFYNELVEGKTVSLFESGSKIVEVIAGEDLDNLVNYMNQLGKAFQIRDDVLDISDGGDEIELATDVDSQEIGKDRYSDIKEGSMTLPIFYGLEMTENESFKESETIDPDFNLGENIEENFENKKEFLREILDKKQPKNLELCLAARIIEESGALTKANEKAKSHAERAVNHLENSDIDGAFQNILEDMAYFVAERTH